MRSRLVVVVAVLAAASCGGGGPSRDAFVTAAEALCEETNDEAADLDEPSGLEGAVDYADDARDVVDDRLLGLDDLEVPEGLVGDVDDYLDGMQEQRDTLVQLSELDPTDEDEVVELVERAVELEKDNAEAAEDLGLEECADSEEGEVLLVALEAVPEPPDDTIPDDTVPDDTIPDDTVPDDTVPDDTVPPLDDEPGDVALDVEEELAGEELGLLDDPVAEAEALALPPGPPDGAELTTVTDDSGRLRVDVPTLWTDVEAPPEDVADVAVVRAAPDLPTFEAGFDTPGLVLTATPGTDGNLVPLLSGTLPDECVSAGRGRYSDPLYVGLYELGTDCGGTSSAIVVLAAKEISGDNTALLLVQLSSTADVQALEDVLRTFNAEFDEVSDSIGTD